MKKIKPELTPFLSSSWHLNFLLFVFFKGFVQLNLAARSSFRFIPTNISFPEDLTDEMRREALLNSLMLVKDDRTIVSTVRDPTFVPEKDVLLNLYTRKNSVESFVLKLNDPENLAISPFRSDKVTKIIIHGWTDSADTNWVKDMGKNFLAAGDYNVVSVDWSAGSMKAYFVAARLTQRVCKIFLYFEFCPHSKFFKIFSAKFRLFSLKFGFVFAKFWCFIANFVFFPKVPFFAKFEFFIAKFRISF